MSDFSKIYPERSVRVKLPNGKYGYIPYSRVRRLLEGPQKRSPGARNTANTSAYVKRCAQYANKIKYDPSKGPFSIVMRNGKLRIYAYECRGDGSIWMKCVCLTRRQINTGLAKGRIQRYKIGDDYHYIFEVGGYMPEQRPGYGPPSPSFHGYYLVTDPYGKVVQAPAPAQA